MTETECCNAEVILARPFISERSGIRWQPVVCAWCGKELERVCLGIADRGRWQAFCEQHCPTGR